MDNNKIIQALDLIKNILSELVMSSDDIKYTNAARLSKLVDELKDESE